MSHIKISHGLEKPFKTILNNSDGSTTSPMLVVEPDYLPDSEVFYFQPCLYPMKYLHPKSMYTLPRGGVQRGGTPFARSGGEAPEGKIAL
jgi:hypothetical protein